MKCGIPGVVAAIIATSSIALGVAVAAPHSGDEGASPRAQLPSSFRMLAQDAPASDAVAPPPESSAPAAVPDNAGGPPLPTILRSEADMPEPVRVMRQKLIDAAKSGDIERLRALMQAQAEPPAVALGDPGDPIDYLKALSADADGREILAILLEVLQSGFVHVDAGTDKERYLWPYFADYPLNALTPGQIVELYTLVTAADLEDMKSYGAYTYFRVGIAPDGRWLFFLAGD